MPYSIHCNRASDGIHFGKRVREGQGCSVGLEVKVLRTAGRFLFDPTYHQLLGTDNSLKPNPSLGGGVSFPIFLCGQEKNQASNNFLRYGAVFA